MVWQVGHGAPSAHTCTCLPCIRAPPQVSRTPQVATSQNPEHTSALLEHRAQLVSMEAPYTSDRPGASGQGAQWVFGTNKFTDEDHARIQEVCTMFCVDEPVVRSPYARCPLQFLLVSLAPFCCCYAIIPPEDRTV